MKNNEKQFYLVDFQILPEAIKKTIRVKEMLKNDTSATINSAVHSMGISRSAYYKYKDHVFLLSEGSKGRKATFSFLVRHEPGVLALILEKLKVNKANIITINQDIPINNAASVNLTVDTSNMLVGLKEFVDSFDQEDYIISVHLVAVE